MRYLLYFSIILLSGHGSWFISGYNTASKEEKEKYDEKKLCRTMGIGMSIIAILALTMGLFENILPAFFVYIALGIIVVDVVVIIILENTLCKKSNKLSGFEELTEKKALYVLYLYYF